MASLRSWCLQQTLTSTGVALALQDEDTLALQDEDTPLHFSTAEAGEEMDRFIGDIYHKLQLIDR